MNEINWEEMENSLNKPYDDPQEETPEENQEPDTDAEWDQDR